MEPQRTLYKAYALPQQGVIIHVFHDIQESQKVDQLVLPHTPSEFAGQLQLADPFPYAMHYFFKVCIKRSGAVDSVLGS